MCSLGIQAESDSISLDTVNKSFLFFWSIDHINQPLHGMSTLFINANFNEIVVNVDQNGKPLICIAFPDKLLYEVISISIKVYILKLPVNHKLVDSVSDFG
jgi:hypothetical protein